ncbi:MAG: hypothetical protein ACK2T7_03725, partial [Anaerolineales bacterium]
PTYAVRQLQDSLAYEIIKARIHAGAALVLSSAATLAFGRYTIPVYEIFKVGEDPYWKDGLDFFGAFNLPLSIVPHWNNNDGGGEVDTSHCFIGKPRFDALYQILPEDQVILGIDDHTSIAIDLDAHTCHVMGNGRVTVLKNREEYIFNSGEQFDLNLIGDPIFPPAGEGIDPGVWGQAMAAHQQRLEQAAQAPPPPPDEVLALVTERETIRTQKNWAASDQLRDQIADLGWQVNDTPDGPELLPLE